MDQLNAAHFKHDWSTNNTNAVPTDIAVREILYHIMDLLPYARNSYTELMI